MNDDIEQMLHDMYLEDIHERLKRVLTSLSKEKLAELASKFMVSLHSENNEMLRWLDDAIKCKSLQRIAEMPTHG